MFYLSCRLGLSSSHQQSIFSALYCKILVKSELCNCHLKPTSFSSRYIFISKTVYENLMDVIFRTVSVQSLMPLNSLFVYIQRERLKK